MVGKWEGPLRTPEKELYQGTKGLLRMKFILNKELFLKYSGLVQL